MNYTELVAAAKAYADRNDIEVDSNMDTFIVMVEARINRLLKTRKQSTRAYTPSVAGQEYYTLPPDYAGMRNVQIDTALPYLDHSIAVLDYLSPDQFDIQRGKPYAGSNYYAVMGDQIQIYPVMDAGYSIEMFYYQKVTPLTDSAPNNWVSSDHPDIYLSGIIGEIETFVKNYEVAAGWFGRMQIAVDELDNSDVQERWAGGPLRVRVAQ